MDLQHERASPRANPGEPLPAQLRGPQSHGAEEPPPDNSDDYVFMKKLNADEPYSLLKCGKPWTLAIASFEGGTVLKDRDNSGSFLDKLLGRDGGERLSAAALNAHKLAEALHEDRQLRLETYVLHTRY